MRKIRIELAAFVLLLLIGGTFVASSTNFSIDKAVGEPILAQHGTFSGEDSDQCSIGKNDTYPENLSSQIAQVEEDIKALDKEINLKRKELKDLYKMAENKEGVWNEIYEVKWDIESLNR